MAQSALERTVRRILGIDNIENRNVMPSWMTTGRFPYVVPGTGLKDGQDTLQLSAVYACVSKIADTICSLELGIEEVDEEGQRTLLPNHPLAPIIGQEPNPNMGAFEFWQMIISDALLYGAGHALILPEQMEIYWIPATDIHYTVEESTGRRFYSYTGAPTPVPQEYILEIKAFRGLSPTTVQLQNLKMAKSLQDFGVTFYENGGLLGGILSTKERLDGEMMKDIQDRWETEYMGAGKEHKIAILSGGFTYQPLTVPFEQMQFIQAKRYSATEICRVYQVPPEMVGIETNSSTYANFEQKNLQFFQSAVYPWIRRIEMELSRKLLTNQSNLYPRFDVDSLLRADSSSRSQYYKTLLDTGVFSINEVRGKEGMGPVVGGDNHHVQINQIPISSMEDYAKQFTNGGQLSGTETIQKTEE